MTRTIAIAIVELNDRFLIGIRPPDKTLPGCDEFPGGEVEAGENVFEAAVRECREETGIQVTPIRLRCVIQHTYSHGTIELHFVDCRPGIDFQTGEVCRPSAEPPEPHAPFRWVDRADLANCRFPAANLRVVQELLGRSNAEANPPASPEQF